MVYACDWKVFESDRWVSVKWVSFLNVDLTEQILRNPSNFDDVLAVRRNILSRVLQDSSSWILLETHVKMHSLELKKSLEDTYGSDTLPRVEIWFKRRFFWIPRPRYYVLAIFSFKTTRHAHIKKETFVHADRQLQLRKWFEEYHFMLCGKQHQK